MLGLVRDAAGIGEFKGTKALVLVALHRGLNDGGFCWFQLTLQSGGWYSAQAVFSK